MQIHEQLHEQLLDALDDVICFCGNYKRMGKPFCFQCFDSLPKDWQLRIAQSVIRHLVTEQSHQYDAAREWLKKFHSSRFPSRDSAPLS